MIRLQLLFAISIGNDEVEKFRLPARPKEKGGFLVFEYQGKTIEVALANVRSLVHE